MAYAWVAGADPQHNSSGATSCYTGATSSSAPKTRFDFVGANLPAVAFFKRGLGGDLIPYYATEYFGTPWLRRAASLKRFLSRLNPMSENDADPISDEAFWSDVRDQFPLLRDRIYFNTSTMGICPQPVLHAVQRTHGAAGAERRQRSFG